MQCILHANSKVRAHRGQAAFREKGLSAEFDVPYAAGERSVEAISSRSPIVGMELSRSTG